MRLFYLMLFSLLSLTSYSQNEASEYFYPWRTFNYSYEPDGPNKNVVAEYKMSKNNTLTKKIEVYQGLYATPVYETVYYLQSVDSIQAVVSTRQIVTDYQRRERNQKTDVICLFFLPLENGARNWKESQNGNELTCSSEYVYIKFNYQNEVQYREAVRITKTFQKGNDTCTQFSYWLKNLSRIASYQINNSQNPSITEIAIELHKNPIIEEVTKEEFEENK